jgi:cytochrome c
MPDQTESFNDLGGLFMRSKINNLPFITLAVLGLIGLSACSKKEEAAAPEAAATTTAAAPEAASNVVADAAATAAPATDAISEEDKAALAKLAAPYKDADLANGKKQFALCKACHTIDAAGGNKTGPSLHGVVGRASGSAAGFTYSDAMKGAGKTWDLTTIDSYLKDPKGYVAGNKMAFAGIPNETNRRDVIAYIAVTNKK